MPAALNLEKPPTLSLHASGKFMVRIPKRLGGGSKWFGSDEDRARLAYDEWLGSVWADICGEPSSDTADRKPNELRAATDGKVPRRGGMPNSAQTLKVVADSLFALVDAESGPAGQQNVRYRLRLFLEKFGSRPADSLTPADLIGFKAELTSQYRPQFTNCVLVYVRRLLNWAWESGAIEAPYRLKVLKAVPKGAVKSKAIAAAQVRALIAEVAKRNRPLALAMLTQFYGLMRPSECPKVLGGIGEQVAPGVSMIETKTTRRSGELRPVILSKQAEKVVAEFRRLTARRKRYGSHNAYRLACNWAGKGIGKERLQELIGRAVLSPHFLRHSAVQAAFDSGMREDHVRLAMGRVRPRVDRTYGQLQEFAEVRRSVSVLAKVVPLSTVGL